MLRRLKRHKNKDKNEYEEIRQTIVGIANKEFLEFISTDNLETIRVAYNGKMTAVWAELYYECKDPNRNNITFIVSQETQDEIMLELLDDQIWAFVLNKRLNMNIQEKDLFINSENNFENYTKIQNIISNFDKKRKEMNLPLNMHSMNKVCDVVLAQQN